MGEDTPSRPGGLWYFVDRMCRSLDVRAALTDDQLEVIWVAGDEPAWGEHSSRSLTDLVPVEDRASLAELQSLLAGQEHASTAAPSGTTYHVSDSVRAGEDAGLLWYWQPPSVQRARIASERAELLEQAVNRFLVDLRILGLGATGRTSGQLPGIESLSPRERAVVDALVRGGRTVTIARELYVSQSTVRSHLSSAFRKLGVTSQAELMERLGAGTLDLRDGVLDAAAGSGDDERQDDELQDAVEAEAVEADEVR